MTTAASPTTTDAALVLVNDATYTGFEEVRGLARYRDGSLLLITHRVSYLDDPGIPLAGPVAYRTRGTDPVGPWHMVWACPEPLRAFVTSQPVGANATVSNRRIEVIDYTSGLPDRAITIHRGPNTDTFVGY